MALATITRFCGQQALGVCDQKCHKAWGINSRPRERNNNDYIMDEDLGVAPVDPGTSEGDHAKPLDAKHNKWCFRECERFGLSDPGGNTAQSRTLCRR